MFAATDTTSNSLTLILDRLAENPHVQDKLRAELAGAKSRLEGDDIPYDELMSLPYLDAVCAETLRVYVAPTYLIFPISDFSRRHVPAPLRFRE